MVNVVCTHAIFMLQGQWTSKVVTKEWLLSGHSGLIGGLLQRWLSFCKVFLSPQKSAGALTVTVGFWSHPWLPLQLSLDGCSARLGRGGSELLPFMDDGGHCGTFSIRHFSLPFSRFMPVFEVYRQVYIPLTWCLVCGLDMHCHLWTGVCLYKSCPSSWIYRKWTPIKL